MITETKAEPPPTTKTPRFRSDVARKHVPQLLRDGAVV